jgi:hypothetical protein
MLAVGDLPVMRDPHHVPRSDRQRRRVKHLDPGRLVKRQRRLMPDRHLLAAREPLLAF